MKTRKFNLENYTGESVVVSYSVKNRSFEFNDESFTLGEFEFVYGQQFSVSLLGANWTGEIASFIVQTDANTPTLMEAAVIAATRYAANYI